MRTLTVTVCQLDNRAQHRPEALRALRRHVVERGSELLVLPELPFSDWLAADPVPDAARWQHSVEAHRAAVDRLQDLGVRAAVASRPTVEVTGSRRNQAFIWTLEAGAARVRDKRYLPDEPGYWEASWYDRGDPEFPTVLVADARIGILVCTDLWFFEWARHYARSGVDLLCLPRAALRLARQVAGRWAGSRHLFWRLLHLLQPVESFRRWDRLRWPRVGGQPRWQRPGHNLSRGAVRHCRG